MDGKKIEQMNAPETNTTEDIDIENALFTIKKLANKRKPRKKKSHSYTVTNEDLLYKIADAGLLCEMRGMESGEHRAWYFNRNPDVKAVVDQFQAAGGTV